MSNVSLTSGMKSSLLSLQSTQKLVDKTNQALTTGKRVAEPSDDPAAYYAAVTLGDRATDLSSRLDGMSQAVQAIKAADNGIQAMRSVLSNMKAVVENALTTDEDDDSTRAAMGKKFNDLLVQLQSFANDSAYGGINLLTDDQQITVQLGQKYNESTFNVQGFNVAGATEIDEDGEVAALKREDVPASWKVDAEGVDSRTLDYDPANPETLTDFQVYEYDQANGTITYTDETGARHTKAGVANVQELNGVVYYNTRYDASTPVTEAGAAGPVFNGLEGFSTSGVVSTSDTLKYYNNAGEVVTVNNVNTDTGASPAGMTPVVNSDGTLSYKTSSGADVTVKDFSPFKYDSYSETEGYTISYMDGTGEQTVTPVAGRRIENASFDGTDVKYDLYQGTTEPYASEVSKYAFALNKVEDPNSIVGIKSYGTDATTASGHEIDWANAGSYKHDLGSVLNSIEEIDEVLKTRSKLFSFDQSTVTLRQDYTQEFINTLETGSDNLTLADLNEEAANLLALQTAQQLGVQSMSLAHEQTQSVLRLLQ